MVVGTVGTIKRRGNGMTIHCEGQGCAIRASCGRYLQRAGAALLARVLCRPGAYAWLVAA